MNKIAHYLQEHLSGEVTSSPDIRRHFTHDGSILQLVPSVVVYPRNEGDIRKTVRFAWQLAQRGKVLPITARGGGSNSVGNAISSGVIMVFTAHMNEILELNAKKRFMVVQPGLTYNVAEQVLYSHGLFLPPYPTFQAYATIGGGMANNAIGEKSVKYGSTEDYVRSLRVVLSNGEVIETGPLGKKELNHKLGLQSFEGEVYRSLDKLLEENAEFIDRAYQGIRAHHNSVGYNLFNVKKKHQFDLTPLFIGSEGTLGIISEATLDLKDYNPQTSQALISLEDVADLYEVLPRILELKPSMCEMLNRAAIEQVKSLNPNQLAGIRLHEAAALHLFVEFDEPKEADRKKCQKQLHKITEKVGAWLEIAENADKQEILLKLRQSIATTLMQPQLQAKAVPVAEDICVPVDRLVEFLHKVEAVYSELGWPAAVWGQAGSGVVRMQPTLDLSNTGDRQKLFRIQDSLYASAVELGGSLSAGNGDGRLRAPYISLQYGEELYQLMMQVKKIFDPQGILNPGVKTASMNEVKTLMRTGYDSGRFAEHIS